MYKVHHHYISLVLYNLEPSISTTTIFKYKILVHQYLWSYNNYSVVTTLRIRRCF